jgi:hypothetical protein
MLEELAEKYKMSTSELIRFLIKREYERMLQFYAEDFLGSE